MAGWRAAPPPPCCIWAPAWRTGWPTCTTHTGAGTPLLNIVGDHATHHKRYDAPLESDIDSLARPVSGWIRRSARSADVGADAADAVAAARRPPGGVATLILPADVSWSAGGEPAAPPVIRRPAPVPDDVVTVRGQGAAQR